MMLFRGYIDESYGANQNIFALSCILARGKEWGEFERKWKLHLAAKNRELTKAGRPLISRYHASDCSGRRKEFRGWSRDERNVFVRGLFQIFRQIRTFTVVYDVRIDDICEVFPEYAKDRLEATYFWLTTFMLIQIGKDLNGTPKNGSAPRFTLFHDRTASSGKYDPTILQAFNRLKNDQTFTHREKFTTIASLGWEVCIALQPSDLVAFECYKQAEARLEARASRRSFEELLNIDTFGIHSKTVNLDELLKLRYIVDAAKERKAKYEISRQRYQTEE
jgi:hypothetical protein